MKSVFVLIVLVGLSLALGDNAPPVPAARPVELPVTPILPHTFRILLSRSIFARNGVAVQRIGPESGPGMALRGVVVQDGICIAIFEDPATHQTQSVREGGMINGGRVSHITLRGVEFALGSEKTQIAIGQNLKGEVVPLPAPPPPTAVATNAPGDPSSAPPTTAPDVPPGAVVAADVVVATPDPDVVPQQHNSGRRRRK